MNYMVHVFSSMWRIKNQPSNPNSCSDNALCWLVGSCVGQSMLRTLSDVFNFDLGLCFEGVVLREICFEGPHCVWKGIEDFNLEHCRWVSREISGHKRSRSLGFFPRPSRLCVDIVWCFSWIKVRIFYPYSSKWIGDFLDILNLNQFFISNSTGSFVTSGRFSPFIGVGRIGLPIDLAPG